MNLPKADRQALSLLSKEVFGTASKWQKLLVNGRAETISQVSVGRKGKHAKSSKTTWYTLDSLKAYMLDLKAKKEAFLAEVKSKIDGDKQN